ncbi:unnamed protein product [Closterium sp. Yama58-4]|nr:unnamed protein product [Closterium sp. Yama58-4]
MGVPRRHVLPQPVCVLPRVPCVCHAYMHSDPCTLIYVDALLSEFRLLLQRLNHLGIPVQVQHQLVQFAMEAVADVLVEGFSRVKRCSNEGRALMSLDLQTLINGLQQLTGRRPDMQIVDTYIKVRSWSIFFSPGTYIKCPLTGSKQPSLRILKNQLTGSKQPSSTAVFTAVFNSRVYCRLQQPCLLPSSTAVFTAVFNSRVYCRLQQPCLLPSSTAVFTAVFNSRVYCRLQQPCLLPSSTAVFTAVFNSRVYCRLQQPCLLPSSTAVFTAVFNSRVYCRLQQPCLLPSSTAVFTAVFNSRVYCRLQQPCLLPSSTAVFTAVFNSRVYCRLQQPCLLPSSTAVFTAVFTHGVPPRHADC